MRSVILKVAPGDDPVAAAAVAAGAVLGVADARGHPDYEVYQADGNIFRVGIVEELVARAPLAPLAGGDKVFAVLEPERMNDQSANLLLKTLEEPPPSLHLFFVTSRPFDLPVTVCSRCAIVSAAPTDQLAPLRAAGLDEPAARRLAFVAGSAARAERLASEREAAELLDAWVELAGRASPVPGRSLDLPEPIDRLVSRQATGDDEARRRQRRDRTDEILAGLGVLALLYREALAYALAAPLAEPTVEADPAAPLAHRLAADLGANRALTALGYIAAAREAVLANGTVRTLVEVLSLRLGALISG